MTISDVVRAHKSKLYRLFEEVLLTVFAGLCARWMYPRELQEIIVGLGIILMTACGFWSIFSRRPVKVVRWTGRILLFLAVL